MSFNEAVAKGEDIPRPGLYLDVVPARPAMIPSRHKMLVAGPAACCGRRTGNPV